MAYLINKTNGQLILTLLDGTADGPAINPGENTLDINLFGKNYPSYGEFQNENFVKMLENFANSTPPSAPIRGELWYDTANGFLKVYTGAGWTPVSPILVSDNTPIVTGTNVVTGSHWWDTTNDQLFIYTGSAWLLIGPPYTKSDGKSGAFPETVYDTAGGKHIVVKMYTSGNVSSIASYDAAFVPNVAIPGFANVSPGINANTAIGAQFVGTAINSLTLGDITAAQYARKDINETFAGNLNVISGNLSINQSSADVDIVNTVSGSNVNFYANLVGTRTKVASVNGVSGTFQTSNAPYNSSDITNKNYVDNTVTDATSPLAPKASPTFTGVPAAPTAALGTSTTQLATTAFVAAATNPATDSNKLGNIDANRYARKDIDETFAGNVAISAGNIAINSTATETDLINTVEGSNINFYVKSSGINVRVVQLNGLTGTLQVTNVPVSGNDVSNKTYVDLEIYNAGLPKANIASPTFTGVPLAPTAAFGANTTQLATTAFVAAAIAPLAPRISPAFSGVPTAPTATIGANTTQIASTEFVTRSVDGKRFNYNISITPPTDVSGVLFSTNDIAQNNGDFWFLIQ
jgi:hypothetical protein